MREDATKQLKFIVESRIESLESLVMKYDQRRKISYESSCSPPLMFRNKQRHHRMKKLRNIQRS